MLGRKSPSVYRFFDRFEDPAVSTDGTGASECTEADALSFLAVS